MAMRMGRYKIVFAEQRSKGLDAWREPLSVMRAPKVFDLRADPFERGEESFRYDDWFIEQLFVQYAAPAVGKLQGISAAAETGEFQRRSGHRSDDAENLMPERSMIVMPRERVRHEKNRFVFLRAVVGRDQCSTGAKFRR
jgi:hypothetical protein